MLIPSAVLPSGPDPRLLTIPSAWALPESLAESVTTYPSRSKFSTSSDISGKSTVQRSLLATPSCSLWNVREAIDAIDETYEINEDLESYNYRAMVLFRDIREQTEKFACSGAVYTQTSDVEGEVNGLVTYDRRILRPDVQQWKDDIQAIYKAAAERGGRPVSDSNDKKREL